MSFKRGMTSSVALATGLTFAAWAGTPAAPAQTHPGFDRLAALKGEWQGTFAEGGKTEPTTVSYRVISGGSVVMETLFPGSEHEMVTMYHVDGSELVLTHYCAAGNQPHLKAVASTDPRVLAFDFVSATNFKAGDGHMHQVRFEFLDADHIKTAWTYSDGGKMGPQVIFDLHRAKG